MQWIATGEPTEVSVGGKTWNYDFASDDWLNDGKQPTAQERYLIRAELAALRTKRELHDLGKLIEIMTEFSDVQRQRALAYLNERYRTGR